MEQDPCAVARESASVDAVAAVDTALDVCASVTMPAVRDTRASFVEVLVAANVECVTVTPTAQAERVSAAGRQTTVSVLMEGCAMGMDTANATAASAQVATMVPSVTSAPAARRRARDTGEASAPASGEQGA